MLYSPIELYRAGNWMRGSLVIATSFHQVTAFLRRLLKLLSGVDVQPKDQFAIHLAVEEALVNAIKHGNQMDWRKRVNLHFAIGRKSFRIQI